MSIIRAKWPETGRNLKTGDVVLIHLKTPIKGKYTMAIVESVETSKDGLVRSCDVGYRIPKSTDPVDTYTGGKWISLTRSVQRLTLILPVEEQTNPLTVEMTETGPTVKNDPEKKEHSTPIETETKPVKVVKKKIKEKWIF